MSSAKVDDRVQLSEMGEAGKILVWGLGEIAKQHPLRVLTNRYQSHFHSSIMTNPFYPHNKYTMEEHKDAFGLKDEGPAYTRPSWGYVEVIQHMLNNPSGSVLSDKVVLYNPSGSKVVAKPFLHPRYPKRRLFRVPNSDILGILEVARGHSDSYKTSKLNNCSRFLVHSLCRVLNLKTDQSPPGAQPRSRRVEVLRDEDKMLPAEIHALSDENEMEHDDDIIYDNIILVDPDGDGEQQLLVNLSSLPIAEQLSKYFDPRRQVLVFGEEMLEGIDHTSFKDHGINGGARLAIHHRRRATVVEIMQELAEANGKNRDWVEKHMSKVQVDEQNASKIIGNLDLSKQRLTTLPESFGDIEVGGKLDLYDNLLAALPESIGQLRVGGTVCLILNMYNVVPESIGDIQVGGDLHLDQICNWSFKAPPGVCGSTIVGVELARRSA